MARNNAGKELTHYAADRWFKRYWSFLDNPDKTLTDNAGSHGWQGIELYNEMLRLDAHLAFLVRKRAGAVTSLEYQIEPGGSDDRHMEQRDFIQGMFDDLETNKNFATSRASMMRAVAYGYRPAEIIYRLGGDRLVIDAIKTRDPARFRFNEQDQMVYVGANQAERVVLDDWKFMRNTWGSDESPYGQGLLREVYPLWYFKSMGLKDFTRYLEKLGTGWVIGQYPLGAQSDEIDNFHTMLQEMQANNTGVVPEGTNVDIKQATHGGVKEIFSWIINDYVDVKMTLCVLEQTTSTETQSGTYALGRFQSMGEQRVIEADAKWQQAQFNQVIRYLIDMNYGAMPRGEYPRFSYSYEPDKDRKSMADALGAVIDIGVPITLRWALNELGLPEMPGVTDEELDAPLERKVLDRFSGGAFPGFDNPTDTGSGDASGLSDNSPAVLLGEAKKKDFVSLRIKIHKEQAALSLDAGLSVYEKRQRELIRSLKKNPTLYDVIHIWRPPPVAEYMVTHHRDVIATSELLSLSLMTQEAKDRGIAAWVAAHGGDEYDWAAAAEKITSGVNPMGPGKAWRFFKDKVPMSRRTFDARQDIWHDKAFTIAGLDNDWAVKEIKRSAENALAEGTLMKDWVSDTDKIFSDAGLTAANQWHLETVYRTNVQGAVNAARWRQLQGDTGTALADFFPDLEYVTAGDDSVRDEHAELDGLIYPREHGFWSKYYPPNGYNCRCIALERTVIEKERGEYQTQDAIPANAVQPDAGFDRPPTELSEELDRILMEDTAPVAA